jgi:preprotein translocase subunit YajC
MANILYMIIILVVFLLANTFLFLSNQRERTQLSRKLNLILKENNSVFGTTI